MHDPAEQRFSTHGQKELFLASWSIVPSRRAHKDFACLGEARDLGAKFARIRLFAPNFCSQVRTQHEFEDNLECNPTGEMAELVMAPG